MVRDSCGCPQRFQSALGIFKPRPLLKMPCSNLIGSTLRLTEFLPQPVQFQSSSLLCFLENRTSRLRGGKPEPPTGLEDWGSERVFVAAQACMGHWWWEEPAQPQICPNAASKHGMSDSSAESQARPKSFLHFKFFNLVQGTLSSELVNQIQRGRNSSYIRLAHGGQTVLWLQHYLPSSSTTLKPALSLPNFESLFSKFCGQFLKDLAPLN